MKIKLLNNYLLVEIAENEEFSQGGIILAGIAGESASEAIIIKTADFYDGEDDIFIKGDKVLFNPLARKRVYLDEKEYYLIEQKDIYAILYN